MISVYIHIPFCKTICSYCDFCKLYYNKDFVDRYLQALEKEIKTYYQNEKVKTIYIGGGTPSCLDENELRKLFNILKIFNLNKDVEFTFECNIENITEEKLKILYDNKVNRLSVGVQSFNKKLLKFLKRNHTKEEVQRKIKIVKEYGFKNINIDLIYAIPGQTIKDLETDLDNIIKLDIPHISTYSLIIEPNTELYINNTNYIDDDNDYEMYQLIGKKLGDNKYNHYEISNFAKEGYESKHNLTYWNNENYYGFGLGASGYIDNIRYENTRGLNKYISGLYHYNEETMDRNIKIENELILGFRKLKGINKKEFYNKYRVSLIDIIKIQKLIKEGKLIDDDMNIYINKNYIYLSNEILINFIGEVSE